MAKKKTAKKIKKSTNNVCGMNMPSCCSNGGGIYGLGFIGALVYYISTATGFWVGVLGILKALVWPALLVFELMKSLGM